MPAPAAPRHWHAAQILHHCSVPATILITVDLQNRYGIDVLAGIDETARLERWRVVLIDFDCQPPSDLIPDGVIGFFDDQAPWLAPLRARGTPIVRLDDDVVVDEEEVGRCAARHVLARGLSRGACVAFTASSGFSAQRCSGFQELMPGPCPTFDLQLIPWEEQLVRFGPWLHSLPLPIAIFSPNDYAGQIALMGCAEVGLVVPEQCAVIGVDNDLRLCLSALCPLSSVRMPHHAMGAVGAARLLRLLAGAAAGPPETVRPGSVCGRVSSDVLHCADEAVSRALTWIRHNYAAPNGIDVIAIAAGVNRRTLERRFRAELGRSLHDELQRVRVARAQDLLIRDTSLPVAAVAAAIGLSPSSFASAFTAETGSSPGAWRLGRSG